MVTDSPGRPGHREIAVRSPIVFKLTRGGPASHPRKPHTTKPHRPRTSRGGKVGADAASSRTSSTRDRPATSTVHGEAAAPADAVHLRDEPDRKFRGRRLTERVTSYTMSVWCAGEATRSVRRVVGRKHCTRVEDCERWSIECVLMVSQCDGLTGSVSERTSRVGGVGLGPRARWAFRAGGCGYGQDDRGLGKAPKDVIVDGSITSYGDS